MTFRSLLCVMSMLALLALTAPPAPAADWPQYRGPGHDGISSETAWDKTLNGGAPEILWRARIGFGYAAISVVGDRAYATGFDEGQDVVVCLDVATGEPVWKKGYAAERFDKLHEGGPAGTPAVHDGHVYTVSKDGSVNAFKAADGEIVWTKHLKNDFGINPPEWGFSGSAVPYKDWVLVDGGTLFAFDKTTGEVAWKSAVYEPGYSTPYVFTIDGTDYIAAFNAYGLVVMDTQGKEIAKHRWETNYGVNAAMPIVRGNQIFISSGYNTGCARLSFENGTLTEVYRNRNMRNQMNGSVLIGDSLYGFDESTLTCLDFATGEQKWTKSGFDKGTVVAADGTLIILSQGGELVTAEATPTEFKQIANAQVLGGRCWTTPTLADGKIYARNDRGQMVCVDVSAK